MKKNTLSFAERIILGLVVALLICLIVALAQTIFFSNQLHVMWLLFLLLLGSIFGVTGLTLVTVPLRYRMERRATFSHFHSYLIKGGLIANGQRLRHYGVFLYDTAVGEAHTEAVDPIAAADYPQGLKSGRKYTIWLREKHPEQCVFSKPRIATIGGVYLALFGAMIAVICAVWL